jgi:ADP-dependent NAD(P)H-hydrate dehydratase
MPSPDRPKLTTEVPPLPPRAPDMHKGQAGKVAIIAGSRGMSGAAILCGLGALRGGAGLVRVYCPESIQPIVAASEPCFMTVPLPENSHGQIDGKKFKLVADDWADVMAFGPGLGQSKETSVLVSMVAVPFSPENHKPLVLDADALNSLADLDRTGASVPSAQSAWWQLRKHYPTVITPHPGEMARLRKAAGLPELTGSDDETRLRIAHEYTLLSGLTVVLKGHRTVVCTPDEAYINTTGNPGMATGGMGDVLTGLIAALLGQGMAAFDAARLGVYVHGLAADHCMTEIAPVGYLARDVADAIPAALAAASLPRMGFK